MERQLRLVATASRDESVSDRGSFEDFFEAQSETLFRRLCVMTGDRYEAEEVMQDAFLRLLERWGHVAALDNPVGYLYRTAMNEFRKRLRRAKLALRRGVRLAPGRDEFAEVDERDQVGRALAGLTKRQRAAMVLTDLIGFNSEEAARMLKVKPVTVRVLASQARAALRRSLEGQMDG